MKANETGNTQIGSEYRLLTRKQLQELGIPYKNTHLLRLEKQNKFPRRVYLSTQRVAWPFLEIVDWLNERVQEREATRNE